MILPGELDYMTYTGMMSSLGNHYDQSNWVEITGMDGPEQWQGTIIAGGLSGDYTVYPLKLLDDPIATSLNEVPSPHGTAIDGDSRWYTIDGRCLGTDRPTAAGLYITRGRKVAVK